MKKAMVFGAGISGNGSVKTLEKMGYYVYLIDDKKALSSENGKKILNNENIEIFIKSPGTPYNELVKMAKVLGIEIIDDVELGYRYKISCGIIGKIIAITGTNGKTTITTKIKELLLTQNYTAKVCGNIGFSFSQTVMENPELDFYILELSSYQLENIKDFKADIALITNLTPDHLTRYKGLNDYYDTKFNISNRQNRSEYFIINTGCNESMKRLDRILGELIFVGVNKTKYDEMVWSKNNTIYYKNELVVEQKYCKLKGKHNLENMLFIVCVAKLLNISTDAIKNFLYSTNNLEHRMEEFFYYKEIVFINDSKGTNVASTTLAIDCFENPILICGGYDKKVELDSLIDLIIKKVKEVYLIGQIAQKIEKKLLDKGYSKNKIFTLFKLEEVIKKLKNRLNENSNEIVLFSPSTSSFDQFKSFEERGEIFKQLVKRYFN